METDNYQPTPEEEKFDDDIDDDVDYDVDDEDSDDEIVLDEQTVARKKLNELFQLLDVKKIDDTRNIDQIVKAVDQTYVKLLEPCNALLPLARHCTEPETFSSLDLTMDDAIRILSHLRELFSTSDNDEQKRLMTVLPPTWGRHRIANWSSGTHHQARKSLELRTTSGILSYPEDRRGNKSLDNQTEKVVLDFYTSDEISRETSSKKEVIHPPPNRTSIPLRFLHMTVAETFEHFKTKYPDIEIARSKFFPLDLFG